MSAEQQLIRREIIGRELEFIGTVISIPELFDLDASTNGAPVWVVDVEIGSNRPLKRIPIKASGSGSRFYAQLGQTVKIRRTALGRMYVIGPGDTAIGSLVIQEIDLETGAPGVVQNRSFSRKFEPLEFYMGPKAMKGNPNVTFAVTGGDDTITRDVGDNVADGLAVGDTVRIARSKLNDADVLLSAVTTTVLSTAATLVAEGPLNGVTIGVLGTSLWNDGVTFFPFSQLVDAAGNPV